MAAANDVFPPLREVEKSSKATICVTGATGYVAGHIVKRLLAAGHTVHATCRDPSSRRATQHLTALPGAETRLKLYRADLLEAGSFDAAVAGCSVVIHTASPFFIEVPRGKEQELMIRPALQGTENVLGSVNATPSVKRVVVTASTVSVFGDPHERGKGHEFTEADWNITANARDFPYFYSKTLAERRAYDMEGEAAGRWTLATINPGAIWGPPLSDRRDGESVGQVIDLLSGRLWPWAPPLGTGVVDVRDVALAHTLAALSPAAPRGRFLLNSASTYLLPTAAKILKRAYPRRWLPPLKPPKPPLLIFGPALGLPRPLTHATFRKLPRIRTDRAAAELGLTDFIPLERSVLEMAEDVLRKRMVPDWVAPRVTPILAMYLTLFCLLLAGAARLLR